MWNKFKSIVAGSTVTNALTISQDDMFNCISENLPDINWEEVGAGIFASQEKWSKNIAGAAQKCYEEWSTDLPGVCESGKNCRELIVNEMTQKVTNVWLKAFEKISYAIDSRRNSTAL